MTLTRHQIEHVKARITRHMNELDAAMPGIDDDTQAAVQLGVYDGLAAALHYIEQEEEEG